MYVYYERKIEKTKPMLKINPEFGSQCTKTRNKNQIKNEF